MLQSILRSIIMLLTMFGFSILTYWLGSTVNDYAPKPYMDEIFHIPQAKQYCMGEFFDWDPKITTPPGLYLLSVGALAPLRYVISPHPLDVCTTRNLRLVNVVLTVLNFYLYFKIIRKLHAPAEDYPFYRILLMTFNLATFPILYFFSFLYYTDVGSTFLVLFAYLMHLHSHPFVSAVIGGLSVFFRQTNIVWVAFMAALTAWDTLTKQIVLVKKTSDSSKIKNSGLSMERKRDLTIVLSRLLEQAKQSPILFLGTIVDVLLACTGYVLVGILFLMFLKWNEGIVLGDRDDHEATVHMPQLLYFLAFVLGFLSPYLVSVRSVKAFVRTVRRHWLVFFLTALIFVLFVHFNTQVHRYVLADNRHYTFYIWRRVFMRNVFVKYALIPVYLYAAWAVIEALQHKGNAWILFFFLCTALTIVPQKLLEFRYFIIPCLLLRLQLYPAKLKHLFLEFLLFTVVNSVALHLFLNRPFASHTDDVLKRFMW